MMKSYYDSPIESDFAWHFRKYADDENGVELIDQQEISTPNGNFRVDFLIKFQDLKVAVECDGKDYHNLWRDVWRDVAIINNSEIDQIFRFRGSDIVYHINDCLYLLGKHYPAIFTKRGHQILDKLSHPEVVNSEYYKSLDFNQYEYMFKDENSELVSIKIWRTNSDYYDFQKISQSLKQNPGASIDSLYKKSKNST